MSDQKSESSNLPANDRPPTPSQDTTESLLKSIRELRERQQAREANPRLLDTTVEPIAVRTITPEQKQTLQNAVDAMAPAQRVQLAKDLGTDINGLWRQIEAGNISDAVIRRITVDSRLQITRDTAVAPKLTSTPEIAGPHPEPNPPAAVPKESTDTAAERERYEKLWASQLKIIQAVNDRGMSAVQSSTDGRSSGGKGGGMQAFPRDDGKNPGYMYSNATPKYWRDNALDTLGSIYVDGRPKLAAMLADQGVYESVVIQPLQKDITATRPKQVPDGKNFLGRPKFKTISEQYVAGQEPVAISEITGLPDPEPACGIYYYVTTTGSGGSRNNMKLPYQVSYTDPYGRPGNSIDFKALVPLSLAREISAMIQEDPAFIRKLLEVQILRQYSQHVKDEWHQRSRPKWEVWEQYTKPTMLVVDRLANPGAGSDEGTKAGVSVNRSELVQFKVVKRPDVKDKPYFAIKQ